MVIISADLWLSLQYTLKINLTKWKGPVNSFASIVTHGIDGVVCQLLCLYQVNSIIDYTYIEKWIHAFLVVPTLHWWKEVASPLWRLRAKARNVCEKSCCWTHFSLQISSKIVSNVRNASYQYVYVLQAGRVVIDFLYFYIIYNYVIPISLYVTIGKCYHRYFMQVIGYLSFRTGK